MPLTRTGVARVCADCRKTLCRQWHIYVSRGIPEVNRVYHFGKGIGREPSLQLATAQQIAGNERAQNVSHCQQKDLCAEDKRIQVGATKGTAESPDLCVILREQLLKSTPKSNGVSILIPPAPNEQSKKSSRRRKPASSVSSQVLAKAGPKNGLHHDLCALLDVNVSDVHLNNQTMVCYLCGETTSLVHTLSTRFAESSQTGLVLPFVAYLKCPPGSRPIDSAGDVSSCRACYAYLLAQWHHHEENNVPIDRRKFFLRQLLATSNVDGPLWFASRPGVATTSPKDMIKTALTPIADISEIDRGNRNTENGDSGTNLRILSSPTARTTISNSSSLEGYREFAELQKNGQMNGCLLPSKVKHTSNDSMNEGFSAIRDKCRIKASSPNVDVNRNLTVIPASFGGPAHNVKVEMERFDYVLTDDTGRSDTAYVTRCFICGASYQKHRNGSVVGDIEMNLRLRSRRSSSTPDEPFFPFLSELCEEGSDYVNMLSDGIVDVCLLCYRNLMSQWVSFERLAQKMPDDASLRHYEHRSMRCERCECFTPRDTVRVVGNREYKHGGNNSVDSAALTGNYIGQGDTVCCRSCFDDLVSSKRTDEEIQVRVNYNYLLVM